MLESTRLSERNPSARGGRLICVEVCVTPKFLSLSSRSQESAPFQQCRRSAMALKHLQSLVLRVAATARDNVTGLEGKFQAMRGYSACLSSPRRFSPSHHMAEPATRL